MLFTNVQPGDFIDPLAQPLERLEIEGESVEKRVWLGHARSLNSLKGKGPESWDLLHKTINSVKLKAFSRLGHHRSRAASGAPIDRAISAHDRAVNLTPDDHSDKPGSLNNLGSSFGQRCEHSGNLIDCDKAISALMDFTPDDHADKPGYLNNLDNSFLCRSDCSSDLADIDKAISTNERAVNLTLDDHADKPGF